MTAPLRSALYVPASNSRAVEKAKGLACDAVILDLEDAVAPDQKADARARMVDVVQAGGFLAPTLAVRVNALDTPWGGADLLAVAAAAPDAVVLPKIRSVEDLMAHEPRLAAAPPRTRVWIMVETARAVMSLREIAGASGASRLSGLVAGTNDLALELRSRQRADRAPLTYALSAIVTAARGFGLVALDGVFNGLDDGDGFARECAQGRAFGFDGKTLIHPDQIASANRIYAPDEAEVAWAREVTSAFAASENADRGAIRLGANMVERLHLTEAERILTAYGAALARG